MSKLSAIFTKTGCAVLLSILVTCCSTPTARTEPTATVPAARQIPLSTPPPTATADEKVILRESIIQVLGAGNREVPRLTKISYSVPEAGDITITWAINDNISQSSRTIAAQIDATNILKSLANNKTRFIYVILIGTFLVQDEQGIANEIQVMNLGFNKSKLDKVHWEDFQPSDVYDLADVAEIADEWK